LEHLKFNPNRKEWHPQSKQLGPYRVKETGPWDPSTGTRWIAVASSSAPTFIQVDELVNSLNPYALEVVVRKYAQTYVGYLTAEFDPDTVLKMVRNRIAAEARMGGNRKLTFDDDLRVVRFAAQAGWHDKALAELKQLEQDLKDTSELPKIIELRRGIKTSQVKLKLEEIDDAVQAGQHGH